MRAVIEKTSQIELWFLSLVISIFGSFVILIVAIILNNNYQWWTTTECKGFGLIGVIYFFLAPTILKATVFRKGSVHLESD